MDPATAAGAVLAAFGLSGAAGLNPFLPLLVSALLARAGAVDLADPFGDLTTTPALLVLGALTLVDLVGDKVPVVDSVLHAVGTIVAPASGAALFAGQTGFETELPTVAAAVLGALVAGGVHAERAAVRPAATAGTAGVGNPVLSALEDVGALGLTFVAFLAPVVAFLGVVALLVGGALLLRRLRRALRRAAPPVPPSG